MLILEIIKNKIKKKLKNTLYFAKEKKKYLRTLNIFAVMHCLIKPFVVKRLCCHLAFVSLDTLCVETIDQYL